ncbi:hypothetical protein QWZ13_11745 [Reinekea marina]|uniref:hypothetical protein n=1 Tax=Reinekea marina TaxID=1310421 RepID=UPI0025B57EF5|nr:hypothetical protein [Reinekea marina]MDN3649589.1 hypothetical protein [Reinekea marina]
MSHSNYEANKYCSNHLKYYHHGLHITLTAVARVFPRRLPVIVNFHTQPLMLSI